MDKQEIGRIENVCYDKDRKRVSCVDRFYSDGTAELTCPCMEQGLVEQNDKNGRLGVRNAE